MAENLNLYEMWQAELIPFDFEPINLPLSILDNYFDHYDLPHPDSQSGIRHRYGYLTLLGQQIHVQSYRQEAHLDDPQAPILIVMHGYTDHIGLFSHVIRQALKIGYSVIAYDLPGHGLSTGERATIRSFDVYLDLLEEIFFYAQEKMPGKYSIAAQSLAGGICMDWILHAEEKGIVLPLSKIVLFAPLVRPLAWWQAKIGYFFLRIFLKGMKRAYGPNSQDQAFLDFVKNKDPLQHDFLPTQWVGAMLHWVKKMHRYEKSEFPLVVIQGTNDHTVDWKYNMKFIKKVFPNAEIYLVEGAGHHIVNEELNLRAEVFDPMIKALT